MSFAMAMAVSAMRFEKPHSLSYQDSTRTKLPSMTLVWSMWNTDECGSWLKSDETFGAFVLPRMPQSGHRRLNATRMPDRKVEGRSSALGNLVEGHEALEQTLHLIEWH